MIFPSIAKANDLSNKYAIDTISTGSVIAFAMECDEKGLLTKKDTGRLLPDLRWGNHEAILNLVEKIMIAPKPTAPSMVPVAITILLSGPRG